MTLATPPFFVSFSFSVVLEMALFHEGRRLLSSCLGGDRDQSEVLVLALSLRLSRHVSPSADSKPDSPRLPLSQPSFHLEKVEVGTVDRADGEVRGIAVIG